MRITVYRRNTTAIRLRVTGTGQVHVTAPEGMPMREIERFVDEHRDWLDKALKDSEARMRKESDFFGQLPLHTREECAAATRRLQALIPPLVTRHAPEMGVKPTAVRYRALTSCWGNCNTRTGVITFSAYLLLLPDWCVEHVVVHELAHLLVPNHGPQFHALMDRFFPRWREARKETLRVRRMEI